MAVSELYEFHPNCVPRLPCGGIGDRVWSSRCIRDGSHGGTTMTRLGFILTLSLASCLGALVATPVAAQATRTWVSGVGDDANPCSRTAPCKTFAGAISKTAPSGIINCIDAGGFGGLTIVKAITVDCESVEAGILAAFTNGVVVNAGANDAVTLRGLDIDGVGNGLVGIQFNSGGALHVQNCVISNFRAGNATGIRFSTSGASELSVSHSVRLTSRFRD